MEAGALGGTGLILVEVGQGAGGRDNQAEGI